jgi:hypothetical protein
VNAFTQGAKRLLCIKRPAALAGTFESGAAESRQNAATIIGVNFNLSFVHPVSWLGFLKPRLDYVRERGAVCEAFTFEVAF